MVNESGSQAKQTCLINTFILFLQGYSRLYRGGLFVPTKVRTGTHPDFW